MNVYECRASGYRAVGLIIVQALTADRATKLANAASRRRVEIPDKEHYTLEHVEPNAVDYDLCYHSMNSRLLPGVFATREVASRHDHRPPTEKVVSLTEWGMPELPSKGSGVKVTF